MQADGTTGHDGDARPRVLLVYYSYTGQTEKVIATIEGQLESRGCDVHRASIAFTDPRYTKRFSEFPMPRPFLEVLGMIPAELKRKSATIEIPASVSARHYDLVVVGSPTWWLSTNVPVRSFLESETAGKALKGTPFAGLVVCRRYWRHNLKTVRRLGVERGGDFVDGLHFRYAGGQVRSMLSLISYLGSGEYRDRYLGVRIPRTNIRDEQLSEARTFADGLADRLFPSPLPAA